MSERLFDYFEHVELATPTIGAAEAERLLRSEFGLDARLESLGSQQDQNFLVWAAGADVVADGADAVSDDRRPQAAFGPGDPAHPKPETGGAAGDPAHPKPGAGARPAEPLGVLKLSNPVFSAAEIDLQTRAAERVAAAWPELCIPKLVHGERGACTGWWETSQGRLNARVIEFVAGSTLTGSRYLAPATAARMGELAAQVQLALAGLEHPAGARTLQWDLQHASRVIATLAPDEPDAAVRDEVLAAARDAEAALAPLVNRLPRQLGHFDVTDDNILRPDSPGALPDAVIDFGDVLESWAVGELAVTVSSLLHHDGATPLSALPAIRAFHARRPLSSDEVDALWPLVVLRGAVLVLSGRAQVRLDDDNAYASSALEREHRILSVATSVPLAVATRAIRDALGLPLTPAPTWGGGAVLSLDGAVVLDAGTMAELNDEGRWMRADALADAALGALASGAPAVVLPAGRAVLTGAPMRTPVAPATVPTAATLWLAAAREVRVGDGDASAEVATVPGEFTLSHGGVTLRFAADGPDGLDGLDGATLPARTPIAVSLVRPDAGSRIPERVEAAWATGWAALVGDPSEALGLAAPAASAPATAPTSSTPAPDPLARRERVLAEVQEHYYARPPQIERGWREHLVDVDGRVYLDMVNNVTSVGHAHPRIAAAVHRQLRLLNTNSRFHYGAIVDYAERLTALLPGELDTVFFVNSGSEATDLAIRLAMAATGRTDIVAMREAYHGWTYASDAVSTSIADNPNALATRPDWVHTVDAANSYRGRHRGDDAARYAPEAAARIHELAASGHAPAGFIAETYFGNAGGVALPEGYLREVYAAVRAEGGLAIADEVQVGFGRLGEWFWGFEQQNAVPDVVAVAKSIGNGHPLGAVVTRREIADRYRAGGYFFSSTGGSPVSSVVGSTVLDIIRDEGLQANAREVGAHLAARLRALGERHEIVGAVHGSGLYLGLEFVRSRATLEPATEETAAICDRLLELGVIMQPTGDFQNVLKIKPPLCLTAESADYFADMLDRVLTTGW
ncbi:aminotransferase [Schumannella sp. 10F1B-5-1]|uniref:aminotransferase n=1 Tax=Schumannella sp. 10F1B-5-1 TaxID=2590780 RepID=UPI00112FE605|nr:aminotransferase [Schumannella sp. 10F1B-5-1]TPW78240.1 aminotransferase [Schumannella sp. 10F1B-5-1]